MTQHPVFVGPLDRVKGEELRQHRLDHGDRCDRLGTVRDRPIARHDQLRQAAQLPQHDGGGDFGLASTARNETGKLPGLKGVVEFPQRVRKLAALRQPIRQQPLDFGDILGDLCGSGLALDAVLLGRERLIGGSDLALQYADRIDDSDQTTLRAVDRALQFQGEPLIAEIAVDHVRLPRCNRTIKHRLRRDLIGEQRGALPQRRENRFKLLHFRFAK
jgi:hypothetical protein